jgi:hypothetical protein
MLAKGLGAKAMQTLERRVKARATKWAEQSTVGDPATRFVLAMEAAWLHERFEELVRRDLRGELPSEVSRTLVSMPGNVRRILAELGITEAVEEKEEGFV